MEPRSLQDFWWLLLARQGSVYRILTVMLVIGQRTIQKVLMRRH
jgi:hypothetical protein